MATPLTEAVNEALTVSPDEFMERVNREADRLKAEVRRGTFNHPQAVVGLEYELYAVDYEEHTLKRIPRPLVQFIGFEKELGLHNAELHTSPQPLNRYGLRTQQTEVQARLDAALGKTKAEGIRLVSDGIWTISPVGESARTYLTDSVEEDGVRITTNMSDDVRYQAMVNAGVYVPNMRIETPNVDFSTDVVMPESLTTSIQPHYQVSHAVDLPEYFAYALRVAGPLLALGVNSPFFPPELYETDDADAVLADHWMENRIPVFEGVLNPKNGAEKVRFPDDVSTVDEAIDHIAADEPMVPMEVERRGRFDDRFRHFQHKHGTFWRWVRPVFDGANPAKANARIEFRALPAQPTIRDSLAFVAAFVGLMESLPRREHPVRALRWEYARDNFYAAMRHGIDADFRWISANGEDTSDTATVFTELLDAARDGLVLRALSESEANGYIDPLRERFDRRTTPASWKHDEVRTHLDAGSSLSEAIHRMQSTYIDQQAKTLVDGTFHEWLQQ